MSTIVFHYCHADLVRVVRRAAVSLALFIGVCMVAHCGTGCKPVQSPSTLEQSYTAEIIACAATAGYPGVYDHQADMRCRAAVDCKYGLGPC